jgi:hypothetical protein
VNVFSSAFVSQVSRLGVVATDNTIAGEAVRCFALTYEGSASELCLTHDGIPLRVTTGSTHLELMALSRVSPPDSVFVPPAPLTR